MWFVCFYHLLLDRQFYEPGTWDSSCALCLGWKEIFHHSNQCSLKLSIKSSIILSRNIMRLLHRLWLWYVSVFHRYYLKNNMETETLCSDEDAQELLRESQISLLQLSTVEVATQLSMRNFELFRNIEPTEYIDDLFKLRSKTSCANLKRFEEVINQETFWVASEILRETNQLKRMKIIKHFIKIALHCRECKNFNSMFAIIR